MNIRDELMCLKVRLWNLAQEQERDGHTASHYVLQDIADKVDEIRSEIKRD